VLEILVQNGADLNAKTKNDETPADICEDPDLRDRILQLRNEQETKKEAQRRRVRRTQSNNTRAQSVRRTSIREKTLTSKKDAVEEARLRIEAQNVSKIFVINYIIKCKLNYIVTVDLLFKMCSLQKSS